MSGLIRNLGICYLSAASVFILAAILSAHRTAIAQASNLIRLRIESQFEDIAGTGPSLGPARHLNLMSPDPNDVRTLVHAVLPPRAPVQLAERVVQLDSMPFVIAPDLPVIAPEPQTVSVPVLVAARLKENLTPELLNNFSLFLYVSAAPKGPVAQRLYVFTKDEKGALTLVHEWAASTGRARYEVSPLGRHTFTATPGGYYEFDPDRMYQTYHSVAWNGPMPYAMFFNWEHQGQKTGVAIHAATGDDIARLGSRASAGCIHLSPEHARALYDLIRTHYRGAMPRFAYDNRTETMSNRGELMRGPDGKLEMADGYRVLTFIENFGGAKMLAALD